MTPHAPVLGVAKQPVSAVSQRLPGARRVEYASDRVNRHLGMVKSPTRDFHALLPARRGELRWSRAQRVLH